MLDTPELIDAWIAERRRRFPSSAQVEEKKRKMEEAAARGQLDLLDTRCARPMKRRKIDREAAAAVQRERQSQSLGGNEKRDVPERRDARWPTRKQTSVQLLHSEDPCDDSNDDEAPEEFSSKTLAETLGNDQEGEINHASIPIRAVQSLPHKAGKAKKPLQPRIPPKNPFSSRPTLLRNVRFSSPVLFTSLTVSLVTLA